MFDDKLQQAAWAFADERGMPREVALTQVQRYAREIVPAFNAYAYFRIGYWIGKNVSRFLYRVRIGYTDDAGLNAIPEQAAVVFVMNHRSNMDYIIAPYLAAERAAQSYAVGKWAIGELELKAAVAEVVQSLQAHNAQLYVPRGDWDYAVSACLRMLTLRHLVEEQDGRFRAQPSEEALLRYCANSIAHLVAP